MSEPNPKLTVVEAEAREAAPAAQARSEPPRGEPSPEASEGRAPATDEPRRGGRVVIWLLCLLLIACAIGLGLQAQRVTALQQHVDGLQRELAVAHESLDAYQARMGEVRGAVDEMRSAVADLEQRFGSLDALVQSDPVD